MCVFIVRRKKRRPRKSLAQAMLDRVSELADAPQKELLAGIAAELRRVMRLRKGGGTC